MAVSHFNNGSHTLANIMTRCGLNPGRYFSERSEKEDNKRIYHAERKSGEGALAARQQRRTERIYQKERHIEMRVKLMFLKDFETPFINIYVFKFS